MGLIPASSHPALTMGAETAFGLRKRAGVLHYCADTGPLVRTRTPSVVTVHGVASRWINVARTSRQESTWRQRVNRAISSTQALITVSESSADDVADIFNLDRSEIVVIPHGVDFEKFATRVDLSAELKERLPVEFALYLGNIEPRKNLVELSGAFGQNAPGGLPLVVAGRQAWNFEESEAAFAANSNIIRVGYVSDQDRRALLQRATVFVFPSLYEGFGFPVLEALAAGTPVVTSRRGALAEVAGPSWTTDDLSANGIREAVDCALRDDEWLRGIGKAGQRWATTFNWDRSVEAHIALYERVAGL
ncbi:glycosyltransferase family 1 protein [Galbitalea sp. SE-J8]|uniref:glycosyltransferase family 4 protein n=1 Tax=Galbitalea sp. SE-J8 TaxID=3054952 RepID=UPI00259CE990|nr:glycosyltransferase family 1 protein [Galbitalea sp. SE-J8]MDM4763925.1 glycosyltransferase family 1 protein [Galbitalea sp. SE-J8]